MEKGKINKQREPFSVRDKMFWDVQTARSLLGDKFRKSLSHEPDGLIFQPARDVNTRARNLLHLFSVILTKFICFFAAVHDGSIASRAKMEASPHELGRFQAENCQGIWHGVSIHHLSDNISFINFHFFFLFRIQYCSAENRSAVRRPVGVTILQNQSHTRASRFGRQNHRMQV